MHRSMIAGMLAVAALALAGCTGTGNFDVQQTEPFRVQLEGSPQTVQVREGDSEAKQVVVATCVDPCAQQSSTETKQVNVKVDVKSVSASACVVKVVIKDKTTGEVLDEREVNTGGSSSTTSASPSGNGTTTVTQTDTQTQTVTETQTGSGTTVVQNFVVNVKGNHNIVVLTQAIEGSADVAISASHASGQGTADSDVGGDSSPTASGTQTATASSTSSTSSTSPP